MTLKALLTVIRNTVLHQVSTPPNHNSWKWVGRASVISWIILHIIYVLRLCSLLQWGKYVFYRLPYLLHQKFDTDRNSKRANVPPFFVEGYFLIWFVLLLLLGNVSFSKILAGYYMFESSVWLLYYFFFRRFFEESYAIMHRLEYIVILPVLVFCQAICIKIVYNQSIHDAILSIFYPQEDTPMGVILLSVVYTAVIFGIFLSNLPMENVKEEGNYKYNLTIVGNGQIVQQRLVPALATHNKRIVITDYNIPFDKREKVGKSVFFYRSLTPNTEQDVDKAILSSNVLWISTPSFAHFIYLEKYLNRLFLVVEKPIVVDRREYECLLSLKSSALWKNVFCLSYYYLEKALPLTFLYHPMTFYENYLDFCGLCREEILARFASLGSLKSVQFSIVEGDDLRPWVRQKAYGGQLFDTFIHPLVMTLGVLPDNTYLTSDKWTIEGNKQQGQTFIQCSALALDGTVAVSMQIAKFQPAEVCHREGIITYDNGYLTMDLEHQRLTAYSSQGEILFEIGIQKIYALKYSIQLDMVSHCYKEHIAPALIDGSDKQLAAIAWLLDKDF